MARWEFETILVSPEGIGTWTFAPIPLNLAKETGIKSRMRVKGSIDGVTFSGTLLPGGSTKHFIVVKKELRGKIGKEVGDRVRVKINVDSSPVRVDVPDDFSQALAANPPAKAHFREIAPSHKKAYLSWIDEAKRPETRARRIAKAVEMLSLGKLL